TKDFRRVHSLEPLRRRPVPCAGVRAPAPASGPLRRRPGPCAGVRVPCAGVRAPGPGVGLLAAGSKVTVCVPQWECRTDMDAAYRFGRLEVSSCGLEYTLELTAGGGAPQGGGASHAGPTGSGSFASSFFGGSSGDRQQQQSSSHWAPVESGGSGGSVDSGGVFWGWLSCCCWPTASTGWSSVGVRPSRTVERRGGQGACRPRGTRRGGRRPGGSNRTSQVAHTGFPLQQPLLAPPS
uniref:Uncharacterized protein n=1 Tax=Salarias fasciatus TaxID=181472 RepID=A0A672IGI0_SALFA